MHRKIQNLSNVKPTENQCWGRSVHFPVKSLVLFIQDDLVRELKQTLSCIKLEEKGVYVQASTLGSLEALLEFLRTSKVPVSSRVCRHRWDNGYSCVQPPDLGCVCFPAVCWNQHRSSPQERRDEGVNDAGARPAVCPTVPRTWFFLNPQVNSCFSLVVDFRRM